MRILVIGCGSIGRRHIRLLREMGVEVVGFDVSHEATERAYKEIPDIRYWSPHLDVVLRENRFGGAIVSTPPNHHTSAANACLQACMPVMVEKPLAHTLEDGRWIIATAERTGWTLLTGYNLRFHPGLQRVKSLLDAGAIGKPLHARIWCSSYLPNWRPGTDYRQGYAARRETGGGVLLDCSHEIDYACWLFGEPVSVSCAARNTGVLEIETEDCADMVLRFKSGMQANVHLDYLDRTYNRGCRIIGETGAVEFEMEQETWTVFHVPVEWHGQKAYRWQERFCPDDMYRTELQHFLAVIRGEEHSLCTGEDGLRALKVALAARQSAETGLVVAL